MTLSRLGNYEIIRHLEGAKSDVYLARDGDVHRVIAMVEIDEEAGARLFAEVARCDQLRHRAILPVFDLFTHEDKHVLVYERVAGASLRAIGQHLREQRLPISAVWYIGYELASGLAAAHALDDEPMVHGRLEPEHVVVSWQADVSLIGLGTGAVLERRRPGPFAAPEVRDGGPVTPCANTYSLAAMLWWLISGRLPPSDAAPEPLRSVRQDIPSSLALLVDEALEIDPERRAIDCRQLAAVLEEASEEGKDELHWHMEVIRALGDLGLDEPPPSDAFPSSRRSAAPASTPASDDAAPTWIREVPPKVPEIPENGEPPEAPEKRVIRSRRGIGKRSTLRSQRADLTAESSSSASVASEAPPESDALTQERGVPEHSVPEHSVPEHSVQALSEELVPPAPPAPLPESPLAEIPPAEVRVPSVRPPRLSNEPLSSTLAPPTGTSRRMMLAFALSTVSAFAAGVLVSRAFDGPAPAAPEPTVTPTAPPEPSPKKVSAPKPSAAPEASVAPLAPGFAHFVAVSTVEGAGVYVFGEYAGPPNEPLPVKCDRLSFVRLGTVPPRHWYTEGRSIFVRCGEVTRVSLEPVPGNR